MLWFCFLFFYLTFNKMQTKTEVMHQGEFYLWIFILADQIRLRRVVCPKYQFVSKYKCRKSRQSINLFLYISVWILTVESMHKGKQFRHQYTQREDIFMIILTKNIYTKLSTIYCVLLFTLSNKCFQLKYSSETINSHH